MLADLELKQLRALQAVATEGSFARAAVRLGYTQSAVSQQVAALERAVGDRVFDRPGGPRPAVLTPVGEVVLAHASDVLGQQDRLEEALRELRAGQTGRLSVGSFQSVSVRILPEVLRRLRSERPRLDIRFGEIDAVEDAIAQILEGEHDLAFIVGEVPGEIEVVAQLIDPYVFVGPASDHRAAVTVADLNGLPMIGQSGNSCLMALDRSLAAAGVQLDYVFRSNDNAAVQAMVRAGMGYSVMPRLTLDLADPGVNVLPLDTVLPPRQVNLVRRRDRTINAAADRFVELAENVMAQIADEFRVPLPSPSRATLAS